MAETAVLFDIIARDRASAAMGKVSRSMDNTASHTKRASKGVTSSLAKMAKAASLLAGGIAVADFFKDANAEARESQKVGAQTAAVLKSTGGAARVTATEIGALATAISNKTGIDDEQIQAGENMLATFTQVRNRLGKNNDVFTQATKVATDLAVATGTTSVKANVLLGKALNDPAKGLGRLTKIGVTFTDQQKKQVAQMVKVGDIAGAQKVILKELGTEFGGSAAAQATAGDKLRTTWANFKEQIGTALLPTIDKLANGLSTKVIPAVSKFFGEMQTGTGTGGRVVEVAKRVGSALLAIGAWVQANVLPVLQRFGGFLKNDLWPALQNAATTILPGVKQALGLVGGAFGGQEGKAGRFKDVMSRVGQIITDVVIPAVAKFVRVWLPYIGAQIATAIVSIRLAWSAFTHFGQVVVRAGATIIRATLTMFSVIINGAARAFGWVPGIGPKLQKAAGSFNAFRADAEASLSQIEAAARSLANGSEQFGTAWAAGLAAGIRKGSGVAVAEAQGVANRVAAMMRSGKGFDTGSPSKKAKKIGVDVAHGLAVGIKAGGKKATDAARKLSEYVLKRLADMVTGIRDRMSGVRDKIADLKSQFADIGHGIRDAIKGGLDLSQFTNATSLSAGFAAYTAKVKAFAVAIRKMIAQHYPSALIQQVAGMGPDGLATAQAFGNANLTQRRQIMSDYNTIGSAGSSLGYAVAKTTTLDEQIAHQQKLLASLGRSEAYLRGLYTQAKKETVARITDNDGRTLLRLIKKAERAEARAKRAK